MTVPWNLESILRRCVHVETIVFLQVEVFARTFSASSMRAK